METTLNLIESIIIVGWSFVIAAMIVYGGF